MKVLQSLALATTASASPPSYQELWFTQTLDHFSFPDDGNPPATFQQRYLFNDDHWTGKGELSNGCKGPILFYAGNEGPIDAFWDITGFPTNVLAPKWGGLLVFGELRYYGKTLPFGDQSLTPENVGYLSTEQALADYAALLTHLKATLPGAANCPVISFGGSYGGSLTAWMRLKYPQIVNMGLAASAEFGYYVSNLTAHGMDEFTWIDIVNQDYQDAAPQCLETLTQGVAQVQSTGQSPSGLTQLTETFHLCKPLQDVQHLLDLITDALETMPQLDYPYAIGNLPAWPVNATCSMILDTKQDLISNLAAIANMYYNDSKDFCLDASQGQGGIPGGGPWSDSWGYQSCTETLHKFSARGFRNFTYSGDFAKKQCQGFWKTTPQPQRTETHFGARAVLKEAGSRLIFSNGLLDPWHGGSVYKEEWACDGCYVLVMPHGAHHLDLKSPNPADPEDVTATRQKEEEILSNWIQEWAIENP